MRPLTFINGVLLGSAGALSSVLGIILFFRWVLAGDPSLDQSVVQSQLPLNALLLDILVFSGLALLALAAFLGELRLRRWRVLADYLLVVGLVGVVIFFLAEPATRLRDLVFLGVAALAGALLFGLARSLGIVTRVSEWIGD
jgi:hypothetical protein